MESFEDTRQVLSRNARPVVRYDQHHLLAVSVQLGVAPDRGNWRTQLVRGIADELAKPYLSALAFLCVGLELTQHLVEGSAQAAQLGAVLGMFHSLRKIASRDGCGRVDHPVHR